VDVDGGFKESNSTARGQHGLIIKNTPVGNVGVTVCYDLRFPELYTALRDAGAQVILFTGTLYPDSFTPPRAKYCTGYCSVLSVSSSPLKTLTNPETSTQVILVPSAFMPTTGQAHWEVLLRSRAIETQCYVAAAAQYGQHNGKR
jgi:predicted amidohydrolase